MTHSEEQLDKVLTSLDVAQMTLRYDRTPADLEAFAVKLRTLSLEVERISKAAKQEAT